MDHYYRHEDGRLLRGFQDIHEKSGKDKVDVWEPDAALPGFMSVDRSLLTPVEIALYEGEVPEDCTLIKVFTEDLERIRTVPLPSSAFSHLFFGSIKGLNPESQPKVFKPKVNDWVSNISPLEASRSLTSRGGPSFYARWRYVGPAEDIDGEPTHKIICEGKVNFVSGELYDASTEGIYVDD